MTTEDCSEFKSGMFKENKELKDRLEDREFYTLMRAYRDAPMTDTEAIVAAFEAVKKYVLSELII